MAHEIVYTWKGVWDAGAQGWVEFFGGPDGLPMRDLANADIALFTDIQKAKLASEAGRRLYVAVVKQQRGRATDDGAE